MAVAVFGVEIKLNKSGLANLNSLEAGIRKLGVTGVKNKKIMREMIQEAVKLQSEFGKLGKKVSSLKGQNTKLRNVLKGVKKDIKSLKTGTTKLSSATSKATGKTKGFQGALSDMTKSTQIALGPLSGVASRISAFGSLLGGTNLILAGFVAGIIGLSAVILKSSLKFGDFELQLAQVSKTSGLTGKALKDLGRDIQELSRGLGVLTADSLAVAKLAAQLGVRGAKNIRTFTETVVKLVKTTELAGPEAATLLARILKVTDEPISNVKQLASVISALGSTFAATEVQILNTTNEVARAGAIFGLTAVQTAGIATAMAQVGVRIEVAGTSFLRILSILSDNLELMAGNLDASIEKVKLLEDVFDLSAKAIRKMKKEDPFAFFQRFITQLGKLNENGANVRVTLRKLGIVNSRLFTTISPLFNNYKEFNRVLREQQKEAKEVTRLDKELETISDNLTEDINRLSSAFNIFAINLGSTFDPAMRSATQSLTTFFDELNDFSFESFSKIFSDLIAKLNPQFFVLTKFLKTIRETKGEIRLAGTLSVVPSFLAGTVTGTKFLDKKPEVTISSEDRARALRLNISLTGIDEVIRKVEQSFIAAQKKSELFFASGDLGLQQAKLLLPLLKAEKEVRAKLAVLDLDPKSLKIAKEQLDIKFAAARLDVLAEAALVQGIILERKRLRIVARNVENGMRLRDDFENRLDLLKQSTANLGLSIRQQRIENAVLREGVRLARSRSDLTSREIEGMTDRLRIALQISDAERAFQRLQINTNDTILQIADDMQAAFRDTFNDIFTEGTISFKKLGNAITDIFADVAADVFSLFARQALGGILAQFGGVIGKIGGGLLTGSLGSSSSAATAATGPTPVFRVPTSSSSELKFGGGGGLTVNIVNNAGDDISVKESKTANGGPSLDIIIDKKVANAINRSGSQTSRSLRSQFGATRVPVRR